MTTPSSSVSRISDNVTRVRERIAAACGRVGRDPATVTLIAVTKMQSADTVRAAYAAGLRDFGENRVAEGATKREALADKMPDATWHLIGHLQSNKVATALRRFDLIHSVDSEKLLRRIDRLANSRVRVLLQVNISGETSKEGVDSVALPALVGTARDCQHIDPIGLMTIAPLSSTAEDARPHFASLRELAREHDLPHLSMGMTNDFEVAIEEGATLVRVGRAIFGERTP